MLVALDARLREHDEGLVDSLILQRILSVAFVMADQPAVCSCCVDGRLKADHDG